MRSMTRHGLLNLLCLMLSRELLKTTVFGKAEPQALRGSVRDMTHKWVCVSMYVSVCMCMCVGGSVGCVFVSACSEKSRTSPCMKLCCLKYKSCSPYCCLYFFFNLYDVIMYIGNIHAFWLPAVDIRNTHPPTYTPTPTHPPTHTRIHILLCLLLNYSAN